MSARRPGDARKSGAFVRLILQYPVTEITIAGNLKDMYRGILGIGTDVDRRGGVLTGSILLEQMTIGGS